MTKTVKEGNNPYNNRVYVDFDKKTIRFIPIGKKSKRRYFLMFFTTIFGKYLIFFFYPLFAILLLLDVTGIITDVLFGLLCYIAFLQLLFISIYFSLWFYREEWRKKYYPELNARLHGFLSKPKKKTINPESVVNNKVFIPHFKNVLLKYKVTKDFMKQLKNIKISNIFKADATNWFFVFEFKKKPVNGYLEVEYA